MEREVKRYREADRCENCGMVNPTAGMLTSSPYYVCWECFDRTKNPSTRSGLNWSRLFRIGILFLIGWVLVREFSAQWEVAGEYLLSVVIAIIGAFIGEVIYSILFRPG